MINLSSNCTHHTNLHSTITPRFFLKHAFQIREFRVYRRRRLKLAPRNQLGIGNGNPFHDFISQFPSPNSLQLIAPLLGFISGATLYLSNANSNSGWAKQQSGFDIGEWVLFTSPTPFNRFVLLRCPSISFQGSELLEDVNEKLVKEDRHFRQAQQRSNSIRFEEPHREWRGGEIGVSETVRGHGRWRGHIS
ncbi:hypothetical protein GBA52_023009 [Prunus armeniaca]|nr:hypothetical protein GBA52_023009 [Prunus armeniaca]